MKKIAIVLTLIIGTSILSCSKDDDNSNFKYEGEWIGSYNGEDDNGAWEVRIDGNGTVTGSATSSSIGFTFDLDGAVASDGEFKASYGNSFVGGEFIGQLNDDSASGTWESLSQGINGTWNGNKQ